MNNSEFLPSNEDVTQFLMLRELAQGLYDEMKDLSKNLLTRLLTNLRLRV